jgi:hypothetical protein
MSHHTFAGRQTARSLAALDFGLRVRVGTRPGQRTIFGGAENLSLQTLTSELAEMISGLRVYRYSLRAQLEEVTGAVQFNVQSGSRHYTRQSALDLAGLLSLAARRGLADRELCLRGAAAAARIADLCLSEVR